MHCRLPKNRARPGGIVRRGGGPRRIGKRGGRVATVLIVALCSLSGAVAFSEELPARPASAPGLLALQAPDWSLDRRVDRELYRLGPGDRLLLIMEGKNLARVSLTVLPEGVLDWEGGLHLDVSGLSLAEAERAAREGLAPWMPEVKIGLLLLEPRRIEVHVLGQVARPGVVELRATDRLAAAIAAAGGPGARGSRRFVDLVSEDGTRRLDLYPYRMAGNMSANPYCPSDLVLMVPARTDTVRVIGEVNRPGSYEWRAGESLGDFLGYALGFTQDALAGSILLERDEREISLEVLGDTDLAYPLRPSDAIIVGSRRPMLNRVYLEGAGERRGEVYMSPGETLGDLVRRLGDTRGSALPEQAILERKGTDRSEFFTFNLKKVLQGEGPADMLVEKDDVLYVPIRSRKVYVLGEVEQPGALGYIPSWTVGQYLALAGGTTDRGSAGKLKVIGTGGEERKVSRSDHLHRGDVLYVGKSRIAIFSEVLVAAVSVSGLVLAINALAK